MKQKNNGSRPLTAFYCAAPPPKQKKKKRKQKQKQKQNKQKKKTRSWSTCLQEAIFLHATCLVILLPLGKCGEIIKKKKNRLTYLNQNGM